MDVPTTVVESPQLSVLVGGVVPEDTDDVQEHLRPTMRLEEQQALDEMLDLRCSSL